MGWNVSIFVRLTSRRQAVWVGLFFPLAPGIR